MDEQQARLDGVGALGPIEGEGDGSSHVGSPSGYDDNTGGWEAESWIEGEISPWLTARLSLCDPCPREKQDSRDGHVIAADRNSELWVDGLIPAAHEGSPGGESVFSEAPQL